MTTQRKAKRKLSDISFESDGAHIALVSKEQGHGANGHHYALVMKAANFSDEFLEKASQIKVTLDITEYLTHFYGLWYEDAEILARSLGFTTKGMEQAEEYTQDSYEKYIEGKVSSIEVMKRLYEAENITDVLASLSEDEYLNLLQDQAKVEKAFKKIEKEQKAASKKVTQESESVEKSTEEVASDNIVHEVKGEGKTSVVKQEKKESKLMTEPVQVIDQEVEVIAKSQFDEIQKAFDAQKEELQKALDLVNKFQEEKKEAIAKARKEKLVAVVGDKAEVIFKACGEANDESFDAVVKALSDMTSQIEKSKMFEEVGADVETEAEKEAPIARLIKQKYSK